jgi:hypothetical protein
MKKKDIILLLITILALTGNTNSIFAQTVENNNQVLTGSTAYAHDSLTVSKDNKNQSTQLYRVVKNNQTEYVCQILNDDGREVLIYTDKLGKIYIPKSEIISIEKIQDTKSIIRGEYYEAGPFTTRYAFTTNALPIKKGSNYAIINLYGPEAHFALSNKFSIGVMSTWIASPFVVALKYSFKTKDEKVNFSLGTLLGTTSYINSFRGYGGLHFGNVTFGDAKQNFTVAAGYAYLNSGEQNSDTYNTTIGYQSPKSHGPIFSIAGITKVGVKASFIFDSMIGVFDYNESSISYTTNPDYSTTTTYKYTPARSIAMFLMPAMRFQSTENKAFQISLAGVSIFKIKGSNGSDDSATFPLPMCTWFYKF